MLKKVYTKTKRKCRVTFTLPAEAGAKKASLLGEFNGWDESAMPMKKKKDGSLYVTVSLDSGNSYRFRYLLDGERWENDWEADGFVTNEFGSEDSLVQI